jgi:enoyl-CoA hydratase/carnithine racemase
MDYKNIIFTIKNKTAIISFARPKAYNALNKEVIDELDEAIDTISRDPSIHVAILGSEKNFAAGADIKEMIEMDPITARNFSFQKTFSKIENLSIPTIAAISGYALGGGLEMALVCDFRIAGTDAKMGFPEINLGIFPGAGGTQRLTRLIGSSLAKQMILRGYTVDSKKALEYGLISEIAENPMDASLSLAEELSSKAPIALRLAKKCINAALNSNLQNGLEFEEMSWSSLYATYDQKEGMRAFAEKRKPVFEGK